jgi:gluconate 2-dehydrogenase gamma chain
LKTSGAAAGGSWIALSLPAILATCQEASEARQEERPFTTLTPAEAEGLEAMAARIVPSDDTPGATEAGVIYFMDQVLGAERSESLAAIREGLSSLDASASAAFAGATFVTVSPERQDALLTDIESSDFFATVRFLTLAGMFSLPEHGGNRDEIGWRLLGFEPRHGWQPPFGSYDADYAERGE